MSPSDEQPSADIPRQVEEAASSVLAIGHALRALQGLGGFGQVDPGWISLNLTMAQLKTLLLVVQTGGLMPRRLAERLGIGPSAVTALVDKLVDQQLCRREDDLEDRRISWIRPTDQAIALYDRLLNANLAILRDVLRELPPDDLAVVHRGLGILARAAEQRLTVLQLQAAQQPGDEGDRG